MRRRRKASSSAGGAEHPRSRRRIRGRDLFFCFSSQPSAGAPSSATAAAMRAPSSKSVLSPGRGREASAGPSLSSSLSRRLRSSGSIKGGQSPMFPSVVGGRRKGVAFEAAEPSSPKVTCIGQVRVKSKKKAAAAAAAAKGKGLAMRSRSMRGSEIEASFRRTEGIGGVRECLPSRNQRWVYQLPVSICEALRAIGSEFNCFSPCGGRSLCSSSRSGEAKETEKRSNSCGAVLARWLMAVPYSNDGKRREMVSVVVDNRKQREMTMLVKERIDGEDLDLETREEVVMVLEKGENKEEEEARVSICIPPKNALLLMRCRSDPVQMAALASRFWESPAMQVRVEEGDGKGDEDGSDGTPAGEKRDFEVAKEELRSQGDEGAILIAEEAIEETMQLNPDESKPSKDEDLSRTQEELAVTDAEKADSEEIENKTPLEDKKAEGKEDEKGRKAGGSGSSSAMEKEERRSNRHSSRSKETGKRRSLALRERDRRRHSFSADREVGRSTCGSDKEARRASFSIEAKGRWSFSIEKDNLRLEKEDKMTKEEFSAKEKGTTNKVVVQNSPRIEEKEEYGEVIDRDREERAVGTEAGEKKEPEKKSTALPDCLLLMMYEPKLSMEVSKETWVCSDDFLQWQLHHPNYRPRHPSKATAAIGNTTASKATAAIGNTTDTSTGAAATAAGSYNDTRSTALNEAKKDEANGGITSDIRMENKEAVISILEIPQPPPPPPPHPLAPPSAPEAEKKPRINAGAAPTPVPTSAYGPLVLTRCKSEPMRPSAKLTPDACFWKDRHRPIGATGIGF